ncbi:hypothetical protein [Nonomuraea pusilla]|uniref:Uncharacterized protein n=1 Tax=Nonomuraea pusilla TaxID=46177 RepID=A0A1H8JEA1_9ACTN|nr:hypothetical protein [Nonomuraea pusilla]SEN78636.1 hypothetical protein SAMN05660976_08313 [Nonomuraea pusilla]
MAIHTPETTATETVSVDAETAVTVPADAAPLTASDGPKTAAPDADPATDADGRVAAVWAALNAEPGGSATAIGAAAGLSRMAAGKILNQFEADGRARREPGVSDGSTRGRAADRWFPIIAGEPTGSADTSAPGPDLVTPDVVPSALTTPDTDTRDADTVPAPDEEALPDATDSTDPAPADGPTDGEEDLIADDAAHLGPDGTDGDLDSAPEAAASELVSEPVADDPAWAHAHAELTELVNLFSGAIMAKDEGNVVMALGCLEMAMAKVPTVHRNARAALTGTSTPARAGSSGRPGTSASGAGTGDMVRAGALRDMVHAHLIEFPDKDFTPYEIGRVLDRSSGAVANALDRLVSLGDAVLTCERPRRFALAPTANPNPVGTDPDGAGADTCGG